MHKFIFFLDGAGSVVRAKLETLETSLNQGILRLFKHYESKGRRGGAGPLSSFLKKKIPKRIITFFIHKSKNRNKNINQNIIILIVIIHNCYIQLLETILNVNFQPDKVK